MGDSIKKRAQRHKKKAMELNDVAEEQLQEAKEKSEELTQEEGERTEAALR